MVSRVLIAGQRRDSIAFELPFANIAQANPDDFRRRALQHQPVKKVCVAGQDGSITLAGISPQSGIGRLLSNVYTQLDRTLDVQTKYILKVDVGNPLLRSLRAFGLDPPNTAGQRVELAVDDVMIHVCVRESGCVVR